jgi:hypothetical protein
VQIELQCSNRFEAKDDGWKHGDARREGVWFTTHCTLEAGHPGQHSDGSVLWGEKAYKVLFDKDQDGREVFMASYGLRHFKNQEIPTMLEIGYVTPERLKALDVERS